MDWENKKQEFILEGNTGHIICIDFIGNNRIVIILHILDYFFKPYINLIIKTISKKEKKFLIFIFFFSLITAIFNSDVFVIERNHSLFWLSIYYYYEVELILN